MHLAKAPLATAASVEAERIAHDGGRPLWAVSARLVRVIVAAERGRDEEADALPTEAEALLTSMGALAPRGRPVRARTRRRRARTLRGRVLPPPAALRSRRHRLPAARRPVGPVGPGRVGPLHRAARGAARHLAELERVAAASEGSLLHAQLAYAQPLVAPDAEAGALYEAPRARAPRVAVLPRPPAPQLRAVATPPQARGRVARAARAARELFDALGFAGMAESARGELRASGEASRKRLVDLRDQLTPQELQIAQMAAQGLTNREIGSRLYLSHRTVGSHLYRLFPKLGITSRSRRRGAGPHRVSSAATPPRERLRTLPHASNDCETLTEGERERSDLRHGARVPSVGCWSATTSRRTSATSTRGEKQAMIWESHDGSLRELTWGELQ